MAETTAESVFSSPSLTLPQTPIGSEGGGGPDGSDLVPGYNPIGGTGKKADKWRFDNDPFVQAQREQDERYDKALEDAAKAKVTTEESGTSTTSGTTSGTQKTTFDKAGVQEQQLLDSSMGAYADQKRLVDAQEAAILQRQGVQGGARGTLGSVFSGDAFALSPDEQARIAGVRDANIAAGSNAVNAMLTERLAEVSADAARRGVRGQAFSQLQGDAIGEAAKSLERTTLAANTDAANMAVTMPGQRASIQAGSAGQFAGFADDLNQMAIQNQQLLQDPIALQQLRDERLKAGTTATTGTTDETKKSSGTSVQTGAGQAEIIGTKAGQPSKTGAMVAGGLGIGQIVGEIIPG